MKKISHSISKSYLPVKIYIDDLEKIAALFDEHRIKYSIETDQYKYDSFSELVSLTKKDKIKSLHINSSDPFITIEFDKMWAKIYVSSDEPFTTGLFHKIDMIIIQAKRLIPFSYSYYFAWIMYILIFIATALNHKIGLFPESIGIYLPIVGFLWFSRMIYIRLVKHSSIQLIKKEHVSNFFDRKRDDLILALLSALVGAVLGVIGTILTTKYFH